MFLEDSLGTCGSQPRLWWRESAAEPEPVADIDAASDATATAHRQVLVELVDLCFIREDGLVPLAVT